MADISASAVRSKRPNINGKVGSRQELSIRRAEAPDADYFDCLTLRAAQARWPVFRNQRVIYAAAGAGLIHAVKIRGNGWTLYPEWELEWLAGELDAGKSLVQIVFEADRRGLVVVDSLESATRSSLKTPFASRSTRLIDKWAA